MFSVAKVASGRQQQQRNLLAQRVPSLGNNERRAVRAWPVVSYTVLPIVHGQQGMNESDSKKRGGELSV